MGRLLIFGTNISSESSPWLRSVHSQLACLLPVKIFKCHVYSQCFNLESAVGEVIMVINLTQVLINFNDMN